MIDGIYYLIFCRAYEVFPPRATLFAPPPPPPPGNQQASQPVRKLWHVTVLNNSGNSIDDILRTNVETTWIPSQQTRRIDPMLVLCSTTVCNAGPTWNQHWVRAWCLLGCHLRGVISRPRPYISLYIFYAYIAACYNSPWTWKTTGPTQINSSVDGCLIGPYQL